MSGASTELRGGQPTEPEYSFTAIHYFFSCNHTVRGRDECAFGSEHSSISSSLRELVVPLKPPSFRRVRGWWLPRNHHRFTVNLWALPPLPRPLSGCRLRDTGLWEMTCGKFFPRSARDLVRQLIHVHASFYGNSWIFSYIFFMKVDSES